MNGEMNTHPDRLWNVTHARFSDVYVSDRSCRSRYRGDAKCDAYGDDTGRCFLRPSLRLTDCGLSPVDPAID
jgi:hypothetical protein